MKYPKRPPFFCCKYSAWLFASKLAKKIGRDCTLFLLCVVSHEDAAWYEDAPAFKDADLADVLGCSLSTLLRRRDELVHAGLLVYESGKKGTPGRYWVLEDKSAASKPDKRPKMRRQPDGEKGRKPKKMRRQPDGEKGKMRRQPDVETESPLSRDSLVDPKSKIPADEPPVLSVPPAVVVEVKPEEPAAAAPDPATASPGVESGPIDPPAVKTAALDAPRPPKRKFGDPFPMFDAILRVTGLNAAAAGGRVAKVADRIVAAGVFPEELEDRFARVLARHGKGWMIKAGLIDLAAIEQFWHWLREPPKGSIVNTAGSNTLPPAQRAILDAAAAAATTGGKRPF
jgi:hypothetical protein